MDSIEINAFSQLLRGGAGLIVGPSQTLDTRSLNDISQRLRDTYSLTAVGTYLSVGTAATSAGATETSLRETIRQTIRSIRPSPSLSALANVRWSCILSFCLDTYLEDKLKQEADRRAARRRPITVISELTAPLPPNTVPAFKLIGNSFRNDFPVTTAQYLRCRSTWRHAIPTFAELVRGNPVVCIGLSGLEPALMDLLVEMIADRTSCPSHLLLLADDPLTENQELQQLLAQRSRVCSVRASLSDVCKTLNAAADNGYTLRLPFTEESDDPYAMLDSAADMVSIVNRQLIPRATAEERLLLLDILFSPSTPRWDPYGHTLDFPRHQAREIIDDIHRLQSHSMTEDIACVVHGGAASGKTSLLKRVAYDLAKEGNLVLWQKPCFLPDPGRHLRSLFSEIAKMPKNSRDRIVYVIDDPVSVGTFTPELVASAARTANIQLILLIGLRTTDWTNSGDSGFAKYFADSSVHHLEDFLSELEWEAIPEYLVSLGICSDLTDARQRCNTTKQQSARDTLSMLYWLLPQTRGSITSSVRDEYFRLGDVAGFRRIVLGTEIHSAHLLRDAYEMVAVAENFRVPLPIEVLVSALGIDYGPWLEATKSGGPACGLLYCDDSPDGATYYRTRNALVTEMLVETINGGVFGHSGELRVLTRLIAACRGRATPVYREFCVRLLVPHTRINRLEFAEGLQLYDEAIESLPHPDRTLVHHKALWIKNVGNDPASATEVLEQALQTAAYPYTDRFEADEHIHTSMAATILDGIDAGTISLPEGKQRAFDHLAKARSADFFNANAVHVHAHLAIRLTIKIEEDQRSDAFAVVSNALADIDMSLLMLENPVSRGRSTHSDVQALQQVREKLFLAISNVDDLDSEAERLWVSFQSQEGFIVAARKKLELAKQKNKGGFFRKAYDYCLMVRKQMESKGVTPSPRLSEVQLQIYYYWMVVRSMHSQMGSQIDWQLIREVVIETLQAADLAKNPIYRFIYATALAHLSEWGLANAEYSQLRQSSLPSEILWRPRCLLLNDEGGPKRVQGVIRDGAGRKLLHVQEFGTDFYCDRRGDWRRDGETVHAFVQFAFGGATVIDSLS